MKMKKAMAVILTAAMCASMATMVNVQAAPEETTPEAEMVSPRMSYIDSVTCQFSTSSGRYANYTVNVDADCDRTFVNATVQYNNGSGWKNGYSSSRTFYSSGSFTESGVAYPAGASVRLQVRVSAYSGSSSESYTWYFD